MVEFDQSLSLFGSRDLISLAFQLLVFLDLCPVGLFLVIARLMKLRVLCKCALVRESQLLMLGLKGFLGPSLARDFKT